MTEDVADGGARRRDPIGVAPDARELEHRVRAFLRSRDRGRREVRPMLRAVEALGPVALFGGMLRELSRGGLSSFSADVDAVVATDDVRGLERALAPFDARRTAFGGYRVFGRAWQLDVWALPLTWAARAGHARVLDFSDLPRTTFFNWDAVAYDMTTGAIHCDHGYFDALRAGLLDINLEPNPNPRGAVVRALRAAWTAPIRLAPRLAWYLGHRLDGASPADLCAAEFRSYARPYLTEWFVRDFARQLAAHLDATPDLPFQVPAVQLSLPFDEPPDGSPTVDAVPPQAPSARRPGVA